MISVRVAVRNATNETKDLCGICNGFGLIQADYRVARCSLEYEFRHGTLYLDWVDDGFDLPLYPPDGPLEPGEIREAQTGAVIHSGYDPKEIRVGLDTSIPGYGIQWEAEGVDTEKPEC